MEIMGYVPILVLILFRIAGWSPTQNNSIILRSLPVPCNFSNISQAGQNHMKSNDFTCVDFSSGPLRPLLHALCKRKKKS